MQGKIKKYIQRKKRGIIEISLKNQELKTNVRDKYIGKERWRVRKRYRVREKDV
jgi:hypothetical protein